MEGVPLGLVLEHAGVGGAELGLVEGVAEFLGGLGHFFVDFVFDFSQLLLDQDVGAVALLGIAVVDQGVVEGVDVARSLPDGRVHEDGRVDADDVLV